MLTLLIHASQTLDLLFYLYFLVRLLIRVRKAYLYGTVVPPGKHTYLTTFKSDKKSVLWIWVQIHLDPHSFGCLWIRIRIGIADPDPGARKLTKFLQTNLVFCLSKRFLFLCMYVLYLLPTLGIFFM
jgi:hypothetical protein